jgi:hypothetical protein
MVYYMSKSRAIPGTYELRYIKLSIPTYTLEWVHHVVEASGCGGGSSGEHSGGRKAQSHVPVASTRTFSLLTSLINLVIADTECNSSEQKEVVGTLRVGSQVSIKPSNSVGHVLMPIAV